MKQGLKRMFLHAHSIDFKHPLSGEPLHIEAPLAPELQKFLVRLDKAALPQLG
jgi:23S rRNA pseudouridine955/2504/2580 synthase